MPGICRTGDREAELPGDLERAVEEVLELAEGDWRRAIRGLILGQQEIEAEKAAEVSAGYVRRGGRR